MSPRISMCLVAAVLAILGCSSSGGSASCPTSPPTAGTSCGMASGSSCSYATPGGQPAGYCGGGGGTVAVCQNGMWVYEATAGGGAGVGYAACPVDAPTQGSACQASCGGAQQQCTFDCAHCGGYNCTATCNGSTWNVLKSETACSVGEAGAPDGAADGEADGGATEAGGEGGGDATAD